VSQIDVLHMSKTGKGRETNKARVSSFLAFAKEARASASSSPQSRRMMTPLAKVDDQLENWLDGHRVEFRVFKTLRALIRQADVPELQGDTTVEKLMEENPELIDLQTKAQEAAVEVVRKLVTPFSDEAVAKEDKGAAHNAKLLADLQKALVAGDKAAVKKIQKEIAQL
jgi:hypothetical protein